MESSSDLITKEQTSAQPGFMGRMMQLPGVESAVQQSQNMYGKFKASSPVVSSTFSRAEKLANMVMASNVKTVTDEPQPSTSDQKPAEATITKTTQGIHTITEFGKSKVCTLKELSWKKTNEVLSSRYGLKALKSIDYASGFVEGILDRYLPLSENDSKIDIKVTPVEEDGLAHAVQTVGKVGRQLILRVQHKVITEKNGIQNYVASFTAYEKLMDYLNRIYKRKTADAGESKEAAQK